MDNNNKNTTPKPTLFTKLKQFLIKRFDKAILKYLTVVRPSGKRKYIWHTRQFKETLHFHLPRMAFLFISVFLCWKINEKVKTLKGCSTSNYRLRSDREDLVDKQDEVN